MFDDEILLTIFGIIFSICLLFVLINIAVEKGCHEQWDRSGMSVQYSFMGGCMLKLPNGNWIPAKSMRYMEEQQ